MIDLTGQVASESIGVKQYSGTGGQVQFIWGAKFATNGKNILAINSTFTDKDGKLQSKIMRNFLKILLSQHQETMWNMLSLNSA